MQAAQNDKDAAFPSLTLTGPLGTVGYGGFAVPSEDGGLGLGLADALIAFEEIGRADVALAGLLAIHNMVACIIDR